MSGWSGRMLIKMTYIYSKYCVVKFQVGENFLHNPILCLCDKIDYLDGIFVEEHNKEKFCYAKLPIPRFFVYLFYDSLNHCNLIFFN